MLILKLFVEFLIKNNIFQIFNFFDVPILGFFQNFDKVFEIVLKSTLEFFCPIFYFITHQNIKKCVACPQEDFLFTSICKFWKKCVSEKFFQIPNILKFKNKFDR
jgi:hypothetical protein